MTAEQPPPQAPSAVEVLALLHQLSLSACRASTRQALIFQILNDSVQLAPYDRATLWALEDDKISLLGISGQASPNQSTGIAEKWLALVKDLKSPDTGQLLSKDSFIKEEKLWLDLKTSPSAPSVQWLPIFSQKKLVMGLWLERWNNAPWQEEEINILNFLMQGYGVAWERFIPKYTLKSLGERQYIFLCIGFFCALFLIHIPLRVVAPCEIVPKDPHMVTAPLEGIVEEVLVTPGQMVKKGDLLLSYDKRVPMQELKVAQKQVQIIESELNRAITLSFRENDERAQSDIATLRIKLQKEKVRLELAEYQVKKLEVPSPLNGVVMLDDPEQWRGKPVRIGEKVLMVSSPKLTKVRMWIPESDNVILDRSKPLKIFLNVSPEHSIRAKLIYIADYAEVSEKGVPSFVSEAEWINPSTDVKMGLKGTAILYGQDVSLFYWIVRRPWAAFRNLVGF